MTKRLILGVLLAVAAVTEPTAQSEADSPASPLKAKPGPTIAGPGFVFLPSVSPAVTPPQSAFARAASMTALKLANGWAPETKSPLMKNAGVPFTP